MQHTDLNGSRWFKLTITEQMANIGSEIERAIKWREKGNTDYANLANLRALELFDLTLNDSRLKHGLKEVARAREIWLDFFCGNNQYKQTNELWHRYIREFTYASRNRN